MHEIPTPNMTVSTNTLSLGRRTHRRLIWLWGAAYLCAAALVIGLIWVIPTLQAQSAGFARPAPERELLVRNSLQHSGRQAPAITADQFRIR